MDNTTNALNWFEIPISDTARAKKFYETVFDINMTTNEAMGMEMTMFPYEDKNGKVSGALVKGPMHTPSKTGSVVYLNANPSIGAVIARIEPAGGKVTMPSTAIENIGYMAFFNDTEGNTVALHAGKE